MSKCTRFLHVACQTVLQLIKGVLAFFTIMGSPALAQSSPYTFRTLHFQQIEWEKGKGTPMPRSGHRIVCDTRNLYSFGGYNPLLDDGGAGVPAEDEADEENNQLNVNSYPLFQELWRFNLAARKWKRYDGRHCLPQELASNAVIREGSYLMVFGGTGSPFGFRCSNQLYICPLNEDEGHMFEVSTTGHRPIPQYGQALVYHNNFLYTIGGTTGFEYTCDIHRLNIAKRVWESVYISRGQADEPHGRYRHEVAFDGRNIYILGGGTAENAFDFSLIPAFDIETRQWQHLPTKKDPKYSCRCRCNVGYPSARRCHGAVQIDSERGIVVFIVGGYNGSLVFDDLWKLELNTLQWTLIERCALPKPLYFHSAAVVPEGKLYIFGGIYGGDHILRSNDVYATWLVIPKLSEICWEALLHYKPTLARTNRKTLIDVGLPRRFIERLE